MTSHGKNGATRGSQKRVKVVSKVVKKKAKQSENDDKDNQSVSDVIMEDHFGLDWM
jgi:hypothetical protein